MARERIIHVGILNIAANPHPPGIYVELLRNSAKFLINLRGSDYGKITAPRQAPHQPGYYTGRILVWTEIDIKGRWLDLENEEDLPKDLKDAINIPNSAKPNYRTFHYFFHEKNHTLYYEWRNEFGESLSPNMAKKLFANVLSQELHGFQIPEVAVTIVPEDGAIEKILKLPGLRTLHMRVTRPNPDLPLDGPRRRVFDRMERANAQVLEERYVKSAGAERLITTPEIEDVATVAAEDGFVRGEGRVDGKKLEVSTDQLPKKLYASMENGNSFLARVLATVGLL
jgi:hypothetical protein